MRPLLWALAGLAQLCAAGALAAAERFTAPRGDSAQSTVCVAMQCHLDVIGEMVQKTVDHLRTQVKGLLGLLEELAWNLTGGPFSPVSDLLGKDGF
ncbi:placenta-specific protein 9 isoform X2 [Nomascus leucogenys]|uniref:placenta-specific protein 9 isoform X2 n=1 Tax=Nomascus leucogenys TaxID=61853 RepID=UPI00122DA2C6|nr:placenta-specific protein 9 isoform X2 [Nomascus leucogenys]